ncbi:hypothetical protein L9F63_008679, partial [Diploptera punctata]
WRVKQPMIPWAYLSRRNNKILSGYLEKSINETSEIRKQDAASVFSAVYSNPKGVNVAFNFLINNYKDISNSTASYYEYTFNIVLLIKIMCDFSYGGMNALGNILTENNDELGSAAEAGRNAVESAKADLSWTNKHKEEILTWIKEKITVLATLLIAAVVSYRLPDHTIPISYDVKLKTDVNTTFKFTGEVAITVEIVEETDVIILHSTGLDIISLTIDGSEHDNYTLASDDTHFLTIYLNETIPIGEYATIEIEFEGELADDMYGFYKSSYATNEGTKWLAATQFQATHARKVFPCFDEPDFKAKFTIQLTIPKHYHALANTPLAEEPFEEEEGWLINKFKETDIMSTYLVAFVVSDFVYVTDQDAKYYFTAWAREEAIEKADYSQNIGPELVDWFEEYTGIDYTFEKIDQVALPDFAAGAMENWGLITYREHFRRLLYYDEASTESNKKSTALVVAHELAHMWFGNLITLQWWGDTWLNEGFARYFQYFSTSYVEEDWRLMDQFLVDQQQGVFATDALTSAQALSSFCETPAEISAKFTTISYSKGGSILRMVSHILTPDTFQAGLKKYLNEFKEKNTIPQDLFDALEAQRAEDNRAAPRINNFLPLWTTQPGFPVLTVDRQGNVFNVSQERFLLKEDEESTQENWWIPLTWTKESEAPDGFEKTQPMEWLSGYDYDTIQLDIEPTEWIIFNNQEAGYYRVNYNDENWKLIINGLHNNPEKFHVLNRAQLVDDALNLARAGKLSYQIALEVLDYLHNENDYIPWASAFSALSFLNRRLISIDGHEDFKTYVLKLIDATYESIGFEVNADDNHITHLHRATLINWACTFEHEHCVEQSSKKFNDYFTDNTNLVPANLRSVVYCTALRSGGKDEWDFLWDIYVNSRIAAEKVVILSALGCTEDEDLLT